MSMEVYILHSETLGKYYVGFSKQTSVRVGQHRKERKHWTSRADDWVLIWKRTVDNAAAARALEKQIKARGAKRFLTGISEK